MAVRCSSSDDTNSDPLAKTTLAMNNQSNESPENENPIKPRTDDGRRDDGQVHDTDAPEGPSGASRSSFVFVARFDSSSCRQDKKERTRRRDLHTRRRRRPVPCPFGAASDRVRPMLRGSDRFSNPFRSIVIG